MVHNLRAMPRALVHKPKLRMILGRRGELLRSLNLGMSGATSAGVTRAMTEATEAHGEMLPATTRPMTAGDRPLHGGAPSRGAPMRGMGGSTPMPRQRGLRATGLERLRGTIPPGGNEMPGMTAGWEIEIGATTTDAIEAKTTALPGRGHRALRDDPRLRHRRSRAGRLQRKDRVGAAAQPRS